MKLFHAFICAYVLLFTQSSYGEASQVIGYAKHAIDTVSHKKYALYTFKVTAQVNGTIGVSSFALGEGPDEAQFRLETIYKNVFNQIPPIVITSPRGWIGTREMQMESNQYVINWVSNGSTSFELLNGQSSDQFIVRLPKADPSYVTAYYKADETRRPIPLRKVTPFDTTAPKFNFQLKGTPHHHDHAHHPMKRNDGEQQWIEVEVHAQIEDNYDPYPVALLTSVTSKDPTFNATTDVDAVFNEETRTFWVKRARNRIYTIVYTGMDASGNKAVVSRTIWAH